MSADLRRILTATLAAVLAASPVVSRAADDTPAPKDAPPAKAPAEATKPMKMKEPMAGGMKKDGMVKGDMKKAAEKKDRDMKPMMEKEEKDMKK